MNNVSEYSSNYIKEESESIYSETSDDTAFDFRNVLPQSHRENVYMGGNELRMMEAVEEIHGEGTYKDLRLKSKIPFKLDKVTLKMISDEYREKYNALAKVKGKYW